MAKYLEIIYVGNPAYTGDIAFKTGIIKHFENDDEATAVFELYKNIYEVDIQKKATFLIDLRSEEGIIDSIGIDNAGFTEILKEEPKGFEEYQQINFDYWDMVQTIGKSTL